MGPELDGRTWVGFRQQEAGKACFNFSSNWSRGRKEPASPWLVGSRVASISLTSDLPGAFSVHPPVIEEGGVKMKLTVIDTPGFGDQINNENWYMSACEISALTTPNTVQIHSYENELRPPC